MFIRVPSSSSTSTSRIPSLSSSDSRRSSVSITVVRRTVSGDFPRIAATNPFLTFGFFISSLKQKSTVGSMMKLSPRPSSALSLFGLLFRFSPSLLFLSLLPFSSVIHFPPSSYHVPPEYKSGTRLIFCSFFQPLFPIPLSDLSDFSGFPGDTALWIMEMFSAVPGKRQPDTAKGIRSSDLALDALKDNIMILSLQYVFRRKQGYQQTYRSCKTLSGGWGKLTLFPPGSLSGNSPGCCRTAAGNIWRSRTYFCSRHARRSRAQTSACRTGVLLPSPYAHS